MVTDADLAPISLGPHDSAARALMARGRWLDAASKITARTPEAMLARGWLLQEGGEPARAIEALRGVEHQLPALARFVELVRARALLGVDRFDAAASTAPVGDDGVGRSAWRVRARALRESGQLEAASAAYRAMIGSGYGGEIANGLLGLARLKHEAGHPERALPLLLRLDLEYPAHWAASHARTLAEQIVDADPKLSKLWNDRPAEQRVARAERLLERHRNTSVVEALEPLTRTELSGDLECRQRYALGRALRKLRRWKQAQPILEQSVTACEKAKSELAPWALHLAGQAAERLSHEEAAATLYREQMKRHGDHRLADDAGYKLVRHLIEDKKDLKAARKEAVALAKRYPNGDMVPDALFFVATHAMVAKKYKLARAMLAIEQKLPARPFDHRDGGRALYWSARLDQKDRLLKKADAGYRKTMSEARLGWYSILAYSRLRELNRKHARGAAELALTVHNDGPPLPGGGAKAWALPIPAEVTGAAWEGASLLARVGLSTPALAQLRDAGVSKRDDLKWLTALVLDRAGAYHLSHDILRRQLPEFRRFAPLGNYRKHWEIAYPRVFGDLARKHAKANKLDPHFVWGVIREESGFNAGVESFANAVGLMQLIVPTAKQMADKSDGLIDRDRLTEPDLNIRLGARYLARVRDYNGAQTALLPAGYNAGAGALKKWLTARPDMPLDLFVELIPYDEARGYTKRVVASWATYRHLYGKGGKDPLPYLAQRTHRAPKLKKKKKSAPGKKGKRTRRARKKAGNKK